MELSPLTTKIVGEFVTALTQFTPENIKACADAKVAALKLTEPEQKKRDACVAIINSVESKLKELKDAETTHAETIKSFESKNAIFDTKERTLKEREALIVQSAQKISEREAKAANTEKELDEYSNRLDKTAASLNKKAAELKALEDSLNEHAENISKAQQLIKGK